MSLTLPPFVVIPATGISGHYWSECVSSSAERASATDLSGVADNLFHYSLYALLISIVVACIDIHG